MTTSSSIPAACSSDALTPFQFLELSGVPETRASRPDDRCPFGWSLAYIARSCSFFSLSQRLVAGPHSRSFQNDGFDSRLAWRSTYGVPSSWVVWAIMDHALYCIAFQNLSPTRACIGSDIACCLQCWTESMVALLKYNAPHPVSYCAFPFFFFFFSKRCKCGRFIHSIGVDMNGLLMCYNRAKPGQQRYMYMLDWEMLPTPSLPRIGNRSHERGRGEGGALPLFLCGQAVSTCRGLALL